MAQRSHIAAARIAESIFMKDNRFGLTRFESTAAVAVPADAPPLIVVDSSGTAINVKLPNSSAVKKGSFYIIANDGAANLTITDSSAGALTQSATVTPGGFAIVLNVLSSGAGWKTLSLGS